MKQLFLVLGMGVVIMSCHKNDSGPAPVLNFNVTTISLPPVPGATADLIVESNIDWQASLSEGADWLQLSKASGHGNDTIHITVIKQNVNAAARSASVNAVPVNTGINLQAQATIEQRPYNVQQMAQKTFGGTGEDVITDMVPTVDGGLFLTGVTSSNKSGDVGTNHGEYDAWMIRLNSNRDTVWTRVMGGAGYDGAWSAIAAADGGFIVAGYTESNNTGDVGANKGSEDWWIIKLKSNGDTAWTRMLGGAFYDYANGIEATPDGGFVVAGTTYPSPGINDDVMVVKFDNNGNILWQKTYGGSDQESASSISVAPNGSIYIAASARSSNSGDVGANHGSEDYWIMKLKENGDKEWTKLFGGDQYDSPYAIKCTADGGAIITGESNSNQNGNVGTNHGKNDVWVVKIKANGDIEWNSLLGGTGSEGAAAIQVTPEGDYLIAAYSNSQDGDVGVTQGNEDLWLLKLNNAGKILYSKTFGGPGYDDITTLLLNSDGSFYLAGYTDYNTRGSEDGWLLKLKDY